MERHTGGLPPVCLSRMTLMLADGISYGTPSGVTVVLDLNRDRYMRVGGRMAKALEALAAERDNSDHDDGLADLVRAGILSSAGIPVAPVALRSPDHSALEVAEASHPRLSMMRLALMTFRIRRSLKRNGLAAAIGQLRRNRAGLLLHDDDMLAVAIAQAFAHARRHLPGPRGCVPDSIALSEFLTRQGIAHDLAFGVSLTPFAAHAWVQTGQYVLSDRADPVRAFTPVFVL